MVIPDILMTKERLSHFVGDAQAREGGRKGVPEIVKVQILNLGGGTSPHPILLEFPDVVPSTKHSAIGDLPLVLRTPCGS